VAPSQKVNLFSEVAQIDIYPRSSSCLGDVGLFVQHPDNLEKKKFQYTIHQGITSIYIQVGSEIKKIYTCLDTIYHKSI